jgi:hypothetical protein
MYYYRTIVMADSSIQTYAIKDVPFVKTEEYFARPVCPSSVHLAIRNYGRDM